MTLEKAGASVALPSHFEKISADNFMTEHAPPIRGARAFLSSASLTFLCVFALASCATPAAEQKPLINALPSITKDQNVQFAPSLQGADPIGEGSRIELDVPSRAAETPPSPLGYRDVPPIGVLEQGAQVEEEGMPTFSNQRLNVTIASKSVPDFINTIFGELLNVGFVIGPGLQDRSDRIALRSVSNIESRDLFKVAMNALEDYGIGAYYEDGLIYFVEQDRLKRAMPRFARVRSREAVPFSLRPVVQYVQLRSASPQEVANQLSQVFTDTQAISIKPNAGTNSLTLSGLPEQVDRALTIVDTLDVPRFSGARVALFKPENWQIDDLMRQLADQLTIEGFSVSMTPAVPRTINLLANKQTNQLSVFSTDPDIRDYVIESAVRLDEDARKDSEAQSAHVYEVRFYDAEELASIVDRVLSAGEQGGPLGPGLNAPSQLQPQGIATSADLAQAPGDSTTNRLTSGRIIVEKQGNRLIFFGSDREFEVLLELLERIDTPADEVLLEVSIAEISLTDETRSGLEFLFQQFGTKGFAVTAGTSGGLGLATGGFLGSYRSGDYSIDFGALATNNQINLLSEPRIVTKSGAKASIKVGDEVPTISSQRASDTQIGGSTDVLQSIQYRETGIILDIEPTVYSDYRIDLKISQEVSSAQPNENQAIGSPVISNRSLITELSLTDSSTVMLGGLIENTFTRGQTGVPVLKDIPILGRAFRTETLTSGQTILLIMITPYILNDQTDRSVPLERLRAEANAAMQRNLNTRADTLTGPRNQMQLQDFIDE